MSIYVKRFCQNPFCGTILTDAELGVVCTHCHNTWEMTEAEVTMSRPTQAENSDSVAPKGFDVPGYEKLANVLQRAYNHAAHEKGKERHASPGLAFEHQPMNSINTLLGSTDGHIYQAIKKSVESKRLPTARAVAELLGAINYLAGAVMHLERNEHGT